VDWSEFRSNAEPEVERGELTRMGGLPSEIPAGFLSLSLQKVLWPRVLRLEANENILAGGDSQERVFSHQAAVV
jgi:hypothetical protein